MDNNTAIAAYNKRTHLYSIEYKSANTTSTIALPRWVNNERTLKQWIADRISDKTVPEWFNSLTIQQP